MKKSSLDNLDYLWRVVTDNAETFTASKFETMLEKGEAWNYDLEAVYEFVLSQDINDYVRRRVSQIYNNYMGVDV
jgi:hypothetical protein